MRTKRFLIGACVVAATVVIPSTAFGAAQAIQTIDGKLTNKEKPKLDKKKFKGTSIFVETTTADAADPNAIPPKATNAKIVFDKKDIKFDPNAAPKCSQSQIEGTTTDAAKAACGDAQVGSGDATAALPFGPGGTRSDFPVVVTAFNSADAKGILLHSDTRPGLPTTTVLTGTLSGTTLNVVVPPLGGGVGAIAQFATTVQEGKYVQGRCKDKKINYDAEFTYSDTPTASATDEQSCKQKKKKK